jgi:hypothetical protein
MEQSTDVADRLELIDLAARYSYALDQRNWSSLEEVFAEDMVHHRIFLSRTTFNEMRPDMMTTTRAQTIALHRGFIEPLLQTYHFLGNFSTSVSGGSGSLSFYLRAYHQGGGDKQGIFEESLAFARCGMLRTPRGWRIREMDYVVYIVLGTMDVFGKPPTGR